MQIRLSAEYENLLVTELYYYRLKATMPKASDKVILKTNFCQWAHKAFVLNELSSFFTN